MQRKIKILFLASNPHDRTRLELEREFVRIREALRQGKCRDAFRLLEPEFNARIGDFTAALLTGRPDIVHFCGHGSENQGIVFEREEGYSRPASAEELTTLFEELHRDARLVFLNACHTKNQAAALGRTFDYTIGTNGRIEDRAAVDFAGWFYRSLADGATISGAFHAARAAVGERIGETAALSKKEAADDSRPFIQQVLKPAAAGPGQQPTQKERPRVRRRPVAQTPAPGGSINISLSDSARVGGNIDAALNSYNSETRAQKKGRKKEARCGDD